MKARASTQLELRSVPPKATQLGRRPCLRRWSVSRNSAPRASRPAYWLRRRPSTFGRESRRFLTCGRVSRPARTSSRPTRGRWRSRIAHLAREAAAAGVSFLFEGAVMDGIPIFNLVRETMPGVDDSRLPGRRQQHDQSHSHGDRARRAVRSRRSRGCRRPASRKPIRRSTSTAGTRRRRPRRWPTCWLDAGMTPLSIRRDGISASLAKRVRRGAARRAGGSSSSRAHRSRRRA